MYQADQSLGVHCHQSEQAVLLTAEATECLLARVLIRHRALEGAIGYLEGFPIFSVPREDASASSKNPSGSLNRGFKGAVPPVI